MTKIMKCEARFGSTETLGLWPCGVVGKVLFQIVLIAINAASGRCSGLSGKLQNAAGFWCKKSVDGHLFREVVAMKKIMISSLDRLECVDKFCYLEDLIGASGGVEEATRTGVRIVPGQS